MHNLLQSLAKKKVLFFGIALAVLANPLLYMALSSLLYTGRSLADFNIEISSNNPFIQTMLLVTSAGIAITILSKISSWILAYQKLKK